MNELDDKITAFYQSKSLGAARMQLLLAQSHSARTRRWLPAYAVAAALCLMVVASVLHQHSLTSERTEIALREAAMNHVTKLNMDFESPDIDRLTTKMNQLNFALKLPEQIPSSLVQQALTLVGARYCTIAGNLAAHLRFANADSGNQLSLFMTPVESELSRLTSNTVDIEGVNVKLWQEDGLFYALADSPVSL